MRFVLLASNKSDVFYYSGLFLLIAISFSLFSYRFSPLLNSDDALNVLMTFYYELPEDLYCWGQARGGTLIPLISQVFHKILGLSAVNAVSISTYLILTGGYLGFASLLKSRSLKVMLAILWFFPPIRFIDLTRFPLGMEYSILGLAIFFINYIDVNNRSLLVNHLLNISVVLLLTAAIWVSDLAMVSVTVMLATLVGFHYIKAGHLRISKLFLGYGLAGALGNFLFIRYAKRTAASSDKNFTTLHNWETFTEAFQMVKAEFVDVLLFQSQSMPFSIYAWMVITFLLFMIFNLKKINFRFNDLSQKWLPYFILDFLAVSGVLFLAKWVFINGMGRWYFVPLYITLSMVMLLLLDNNRFPAFKNLTVRAFAFLIVIVGAFSTIHFVQFITPQSFRSQVDVKSEFRNLGQIGIIANYWYAHITAAVDPSQIKATSRELGGVKNPELVPKVFNQPKLYVIKNYWLDHFPDTLEQFGRTLVREGDSFQIGNSHVNQYVKLERDERFDFSEFRLKKGVEVYDSMVVIHKDSSNVREGFALYGPYVHLGIGSHKVQFKLAVNNAKGDEPIAHFDVATDRGRNILAEKKLMPKKWDSNEDQWFEIHFKADRIYNDAEFRINYKGHADLTVKAVKLVEQ